MDIRTLLEKLQRGETVASPVLKQLNREGYIEITDVTNMDSPAGQREYLFTFFTEKGKRFLSRE